MVLVPPFEQFLTSYTVTTPATIFDINFINLVAPNAAVGAIELDGTAVPANQFVAIGTSGFSGAQLAVARGSHTLAAPEPFGVTVYGFASFDSYGYTGGQSLSPVARASVIELSPATASVPVGVEVDLAARVLDDLGAPVVGVRVDFAVAA